MSTAIMQTGALQFVIQNKFYDWQDSSNDVADLQLKDQFGYGAIAQHQQQQPHIGANRMTQTMRSSVSSINVFNSLSNSELLQNQINAAVMQQQQQQQQAQQQKMLHNTLTRTTSHQPTSSELQLLQSLQSDTMSVTECHRKLERTQSEPAPQVQAQMNTSRYKTELCRPFKETGECKYGEKCQFAHGENELRTVQRHPKYKTEYCRTFYGVGLCPYGSRCHFLHDLSGEDDGNTRTRNGREQQQQQQQQQQGASMQNGNGQQRYANKDTAGHTFGRNITSSEVDAITNAAAIPSHRPFGRSASILNGNGMHPLPMSPPLSMSTGSDRASPICSLSPTNSISNFQFTEPAQFQMNAISSMANGIYSSPMNHHITPPASPQYSPPATPIIMATNVPSKANANANALTNAEKARLPIFNQISCASTIDTLKNLPL